jgi:hypothetical protein
VAIKDPRDGVSINLEIFWAACARVTVEVRDANRRREVPLKEFFGPVLVNPLEKLAEELGLL